MPSLRFVSPRFCFTVSTCDRGVNRCEPANEICQGNGIRLGEQCEGLRVRAATLMLQRTCALESEKSCRIWE